MSYSLESDIEASRLESQVKEENYNLDNELKQLAVKFSGNVLDAGCGTGVLCRYINENFNVESVTGIEFSDIRIAQANQLLSPLEKNKIKFYQGDLHNIAKIHKNKFDHVISRYVLEHLQDSKQAMSELVDCLRPGGKLSILELDGVFFNLYSPHEEFNKLMHELKDSAQFDLFIGRKIPAMFKEAGLKNIQWDASLVKCRGKALDEELENTRQRFISLRPFLAEFYQSEDKATKFEKLYLQELSKTENTLVFTKYFCTGEK